MSSKFTSRERLSMIVVAGVVAIAIAALALRQHTTTVVQTVEQTSSAVQHKVVADKPDTVKAKSKKRRAKARKSKSAAKKQPVMRQPKPRDYFNAPENE